MDVVQAVYTPLKDAVLCMKRKAKYVRKLGDNLRKMTAELATFYVKKDEIEQILETTVSKEKSGEYNILIKQIEVFQERYYEYVDKYEESCQIKVPRFQTHDVSSEEDVFEFLRERKQTIFTCKFFKLAKLSRKMNELIDDISPITGKMKEENVLRNKKVEPVEVQPDDIDLPWFVEYVNKILRLLSEDGYRSIGILGPIGVGKEIILQKLNNQLGHSSSPLPGMTTNMSFDYVIWIDCLKKQDVEAIQYEIMRRLKLERDNANSIKQNAKIISGFLQRKKYVLLINQVSSNIDLDDVGVRKDHEHGKVVVASSSKKVITPMTDEQVEIQRLSNNDAMDLFQRVCGVIDDRNEPYAEGIVSSCGGLPSVIKLVAKHLKEETNEEVWSEVKRVLQSETEDKLSQNLGGVGLAYKLAYDKLEKRHKKCLLFVTLFPSDHKVCKDYLVECWNAERLLELKFPELRRARDRGAWIFRELTDLYLLENHSDKHVKMPEYFRKVVAAQQEYPGENYTPQEIQPLCEETWKTARRMSLICCKSELPHNPRNDNISTLLMQRNDDLKPLEDEFFCNMQKLLILDLHRTKIESLPNSIDSLVKLRCLYLNDCSRLAELPPQVKMLEKLELLDIRGTSIHSLPDEIGNMRDLRCLRISFGQTGCNRDVTCREMTNPRNMNMISHLPHLEELTIETGCCSQGWDAIVDQIVTELSCLKKLSTLNFHFPKVSSLHEFVAKSQSLQNIDTDWGPNTLRSFDISIGCCGMKLPFGSEISLVSSERRLRFSTDEDISSVKKLSFGSEISRVSSEEDISSVKKVLRQASSFELVGHCGVGSLSDFNLENTGSLKVCVVGSCTSMTSLVDDPKINEMETDSTKGTDCAKLQCLEKLYLFDLRSLQSIWSGPIPPGSLAKLKDLTIFDCPELTTILNLELAEALSSLERVKVEKCSKVKEIINEEIYNEHGISKDLDLSNMLDKVTTIEMVDLPMLESICKTTTMNWKSRVRVVVKNCSRLRDIHLGLRNAEKLETIECEESWWIALQLPEEENQRFLPCCQFIAVEQSPAISTRHEGESSGHGRSANLVASNVNVSNRYTGESVHHDIPESSQRVERVTHQSRNTNTSRDEEARYSSVERRSISSH